MTANEEWTPEAASDQVVQGLGATIGGEHPCSVYLFSNAIYQGGDQFDAQLSDLDLVVVFDETGRNRARRTADPALGL